MTLYTQSYANHREALSTALPPKRRARSLVTAGDRTPNLTIADALYAYTVTAAPSQPCWCSPAPMWN